MRLVYKDTKKEVKIGDEVWVNGQMLTVQYFRPPHKPSSSGTVSVKLEGHTGTSEYYVNVIDAEWIEREDRQ